MEALAADVRRLRRERIRRAFEPFVQIARAEPAWSYVEVAAGHSPMVTEPEALSKALIEALPMSRVDAHVA